MFLGGVTSCNRVSRKPSNRTRQKARQIVGLAGVCKGKRAARESERTKGARGRARAQPVWPEIKAGGRAIVEPVLTRKGPGGRTTAEPVWLQKDSSGRAAADPA